MIFTQAGATALEIDLTSERLRSFAKAAAPGLLRIGGYLEDTRLGLR